MCAATNVGVKDDGSGTTCWPHVVQEPVGLDQGVDHAGLRAETQQHMSWLIRLDLTNHRVYPSRHHSCYYNTSNLASPNVENI